MQPVSQLREMHERMMADLAALPQYRALKAMDRLIGELTQIYADAPSPERAEEAMQHKLDAAIESRIASDLLQNPTRVSAYVPSARIA
jgi:hypothetical protein